VVSLIHDLTGDQYCEDVESENSAFMMLVFPSDHDTIDSPQPLLSWSHSDPFNIASTGDYYKMVVVELSPEQSAEAGVTANVPVFMKVNLTSHQVQYPYDAHPLQAGKRYGWQVQKVSNEVVVNKTEAWEFVVRPKLSTFELKYAVLKNSPGSSYYTVSGNQLFFSFSEKYHSAGKLTCRITDEQKKEPVTNAKSSKTGSSGSLVNLKSRGDNRYEINLDELKIKPGFHLLEVTNESNQIFYLNFLIQ
jgi:hypothetical protein